jgi:cytosine/adenosine deaminase-related metal-dependent hydrolase
MFFLTDIFLLKDTALLCHNRLPSHLMKVYKAEYLLHPDGEFRDDMVLMCPDQGPAIPVAANSVSPEVPVTLLSGYLIPGLVNVHTHLELSGYKGLIPRNTGLAGFIIALQKLRRGNHHEEAESIRAAIQEMCSDGIVAAGDIDNSGKWMSQKEGSSLLFHHFFERFGISAASVPSIMENATELVESFLPSFRPRISITPHAPYSCSSALVKTCFESPFNFQKPLSVHMLESQEELDFMQSVSGPLAEMIRSFGIDMAETDILSGDSLEHVLPLREHSGPLILVHNTLLNNHEQMTKLGRFKDKIFLCLCLRANDYIEGRVPDVELLMNEGFNLCLGTDSLASNSSLRITDEMNFIIKKFPGIPVQELIRWASINGMRALNFSFSDVNPQYLWYHLFHGISGFEICKPS